MLKAFSRCCILTLNEHVIDVNLYCFTDLIGEHLVDEVLVGCSRILKTEGYDFVAIQAPVCHERGMNLVRLVHLDLVLSRVCIHEA